MGNIMGPEVNQLEEDLASFSGKHAISVLQNRCVVAGINGARGKPRQGVIVPSFTFAASAEVMPFRRCANLC